MSSPYPIIDNLPIDQLKVTELKEELKRRKLPIKGLKQELVKRLAEAILQEQDAAQSQSENNSDSTPGPAEEMAEPVDSENPKDDFDTSNITDKKADEKMSEVDAAENKVQSDEGKFSTEEPVGGAISTMVEKDPIDQFGDAKSSAPTEEDQIAEVSVVQTSEHVSVSVESATALTGQDSLKYETLNESGDLKEQLVNPISNSSLVEEKFSSSILERQVSEVSPVLGLQVKSDFVSTDVSVGEKTELKDNVIANEEKVSSSILERQVSEVSPVLGFQVKSDFVSTAVSIGEKTELKDNVIANDAKLELDVKPEMVQLLTSSNVPDDAKLHPMDVEEPHDKKVSTEEPGKENHKYPKVSVVQTSDPVGVSVESATALSGQDSQKYEIQNEGGDLKEQRENHISNSSVDETKVSSSNLETQVSELSPILGSQVKSDSVSPDISIDEKIELKDNVIANDVKLELDVKPEMVQLLSSSDVPDDAKLHPMDVEEPHDKKVSTEEPGKENDKYPEVSVVQTSDPVGVSVESATALSGQDSQKYEIQNEGGDLKEQRENHISNSSVDETKVSSSNLETQISELSPILGSQVKSDSVSPDISIDEKIELKDNVIANDVKLELDVKPEMVQLLSSSDVPDDAKLHPMDVEEPHDKKVSTEEPGNKNDKYVDIMKTDGNGNSAEKLQLDRSPGEDYMEEDVSEGKLADSKLGSVKEIDGKKEIEVDTNREVGFVASVDDARSAAHIDTDVEDDSPTVLSLKRKLHDQRTATGSNAIGKRQRRWNSEDLKIPDNKKGDAVALTTPKDFFQPSFRRSFSRSDSMAKEEPPKERVVPPSSKVPTNSLLIENFLRPFTLKAVQELLSKTGTVTNFWMDAIKTHCFVSFSSVEEAIGTRNAVYNLQWPPHGGKLLVAEFVDPQGVKDKVEAPPQSPSTHATPVTTIPAATLPSPQPQPSPRQQMQNKQLQPEKLPPPPLPEKLDPPIVTLDDLFKKTKATPRIYYLPLSDVQVAEKLKAQGKIIKQ